MTLQDNGGAARNITPRVMRELLDYFPETGKFTWKIREEKWFKDTLERNARHSCNIWNSKFSGKEAFTSCDKYGYKKTAILNVKCQAHRVAWKIFYGYEPEFDIDHINTDKSDNRISNLREATRGQNQRNHNRRSDNTSGCKGVSFDKKSGKYHAYIRSGGKRTSLGFYATPELAHEAYKLAATRIHGEYKNYG